MAVRSGELLQLLEQEMEQELLAASKRTEEAQKQIEIAEERARDFEKNKQQMLMKSNAQATQVQELLKQVCVYNLNIIYDVHA